MHGSAGSQYIPDMLELSFPFPFRSSHRRGCSSTYMRIHSPDPCPHLTRDSVLRRGCIGTNSSLATALQKARTSSHRHRVSAQGDSGVERRVATGYQNKVSAIGRTPSTTQVQLPDSTPSPQRELGGRSGSRQVADTQYCTEPGAWRPGRFESTRLGPLEPSRSRQHQAADIRTVAAGRRQVAGTCGRGSSSSCWCWCWCWCGAF